MEFLFCTLTALLLGWGLWRICTSLFYHDSGSAGRKHLRQVGKWYREQQEIWDSPVL